MEPFAGYTLGATDIQKYNALGEAEVDANYNYIDQKAKGLTAGVGTGYLFPGRVSFNIGLRYEHLFVSGDTSINMFSIRISHSFSFGRRDE